MGGGVILLLASFFSCKDSGRTQKEVELAGDTYMSVSMSMPQESLRTGDDDYNKKGTYVGKDKIKDLTLYIANNGSVMIQRYQASDLTISGQKVNTKAFPVKHGEVTIYAVVNISDEVRSALDAVTNAADLKLRYEAAYDAFNNGNKIAQLVETNKDQIVMSGIPVKKTMQKGVSEEDAKEPTNNNYVKIEVRRAAARVSTTTTAPEKSSGIYEVRAKGNDGTEVVLGELSELTWTVAQYEKKYYLQQKEAGGVVKSPSFDYVTVSGDYQTEASQRYDYSQLKDKEPLKRLNATFTQGDIESVKYKYISETTHANVSGGDKGGYRKGNTAYVLVRGKFSPAESRWAAGEKASYVDGSDIFLGLSTGKFYTSEQKAMDDHNAKVVTYKKGRVYYYSWINPDVVDVTKWMMSPVRRNNIYNVNISAFRNIGLSGNPFDPTPEDPTNPDPDPKPDPDDPDTPDPDEPLPTPKTYMSTEVTVLDWIWHNYDIEL